jgi:hypothetical protein
VGCRAPPNNHRAFPLTDMSPIAHSDGSDDVGRCGEFVPSLSGGVDDVVGGGYFELDKGTVDALKQRMQKKRW